MDKRTFGNRYVVTEKVGMGGMAEVFKCTDNTLGRTVAVKVMLPQYAGDPTFAARFRQEAQAAANLASPYIVNIYDWGKDGDQYYIVMEYVRGTDLKSAIQQRGKIHPRKVAEIGSQVCSALSIAHSYGIIHRDIKSANIMVQADGNVKVMDFGIAQAGNSDMTQDSSVLGTAHYVSPEQAQGKPLEGTSDLYSLGVVMYEAACGKLPFDGKDAVSVALKQVNEMPPSLRSVNPAIDANLEAIIMKALSKDPAQRYATANEMRQALDDYLAGRGVAPAAAGAAVGAAAGTPSTRVMTPVEGGKGAVENTYDAATPVESEGKKKGGKRKIAIIALVIALLLVGAVVGVSRGCLAEKLIVPNVAGMTEEEATQTLEEYGFRVGTVTRKHSDTVPAGIVMASDPDANETAREGAKINLIVSNGPEAAETVQVPDLTGKSADEAARLLDAAGLKGAAHEDWSSDYEAGKVCAQDPGSGTEVEVGSTVAYTISKGRHTAEAASVVGWDEGAAQSELSGKGFTVSVEYTTTTNQSQNGKVYDQSMSGTVDYGSTITIRVYKYEAPAPAPTPGDNTDDTTDTATP